MPQAKAKPSCDPKLPLPPGASGIATSPTPMRAAEADAAPAASSSSSSAGRQTQLAFGGANRSVKLNDQSLPSLLSAAGSPAGARMLHQATVASAASAMDAAEARHVAEPSFKDAATYQEGTTDFPGLGLVIFDGKGFDAKPSKDADREVAGHAGHPDTKRDKAKVQRYAMSIYKDDAAVMAERYVLGTSHQELIAEHDAKETVAEVAEFEAARGQKRGRSSSQTEPTRLNDFVRSGGEEETSLQQIGNVMSGDTSLLRRAPVQHRARGYS